MLSLTYINPISIPIPICQVQLISRSSAHYKKKNFQKLINSNFYFYLHISLFETQYNKVFKSLCEQNRSSCFLVDISITNNVIFTMLVALIDELMNDGNGSNVGIVTIPAI